jgi:hypothetical protein
MRRRKALLGIPVLLGGLYLERLGAKVKAEGPVDADGNPISPETQPEAPLEAQPEIPATEPEPTPEPAPPSPDYTKPVERFKLNFNPKPPNGVSEIEYESFTESANTWLQSMFDSIREDNIPELNKYVAIFKEAMNAKEVSGEKRFYLSADPRPSQLRKSPFYVNPVLSPSDNKIYFFIGIDGWLNHVQPTDNFAKINFAQAVIYFMRSGNVLVQNKDSQGNYDGKTVYSKLKSPEILKQLNDQEEAKLLRNILEKH